MKAAEISVRETTRSSSDQRKTAGELGSRDALASAGGITVKYWISSFLLLGKRMCQAISATSITSPQEKWNKWHVL